MTKESYQKYFPDEKTFFGWGKSHGKV